MPAKVDTHGHLGYENVIDGTTSKANFTRENLIDHLERFAYMGFSAVVSIADLAEREIMPADHLDVFQAPRDPLMPKPADSPGATCRSGYGTKSFRTRRCFEPQALAFRGQEPAPAGTPRGTTSCTR